MCELDVLDFIAFSLGLSVLWLCKYIDHYLLCTSNTTYHREKMLCLKVMLIISGMMAQHLPISPATGALTVGCKCFPMLRCSGRQQWEARGLRSQG